MTETNAQVPMYYWGIPDSPLNWCELDYKVSPFICEFYNTISSFVLSMFGVYGLYLLFNSSFTDKSLSHHIKIVSQLGIRAKVTLSYLSLAIIGIGSAFYHATLLYKYQLFDEFPMIITISLFVYCKLTLDQVQDTDSSQYKIFRKILPYLLTGYVVTVAAIITVIRDIPTILQASFGFLVLVCVTLSSQYARSIKMDLRNSNPKKLLAYCVGSMLVAYLCWLVERKLCSDGYVIPGVQLHAIWHVLTGAAAYLWVQYYICINLEKHNYKTKLIYSMGIPSIRVQ
ncbi:alkaline dihydroceramidase [Tieghemostelium lacteum]|uniref:Alkaline dihydroceramidase n=1 Tax=Tieghemostelium lacteum TaxID=361077 RepID=A0A151ZJK3_TIELA|nr:alkaline dihydroceramidase [Tieghemostelium lacteum]|eukprot:KYQ94181.1 alkaline dihydroceramidase [Tieghemostelium lacteum]